MTDPAGPEREIEALRARQGTLRLVSPHPDYPADERPADEVHVVGKVLWKVTRACPRPVPRLSPTPIREPAARRVPPRRGSFGEGPWN